MSKATTIYKQIDKVVCDFGEAIFVKLKMMPERGSTRVMRVPYTTTQKLGVFPFRHYYENVWFFKYCFISFLIVLPIFHKIGKLSRSPENVKKWKEIRAKERVGHH